MEPCHGKFLEHGQLAMFSKPADGNCRITHSLSALCGLNLRSLAVVLGFDSAELSCHAKLTEDFATAPLKLLERLKSLSKRPQNLSFRN